MEQLSSEVMYRNPWMSVRQDEIRRADGTTGIYGVVDKPDFSLVIPRENDGFWLVQQYRYPIQRRAWEFPQGSWGAASGTQSDLARAELAEETGLRANSLDHLGHLYGAYGFSSQGFDVFLATGLEAGETGREATEINMTHAWFSESDFAGLVKDEQIIDAATLAAYVLLTLSR